jgi:hypothetical protein
VKRTALLGLAVALAFGIDVAPAAAKAKKVESVVEIDGWGPPNTYDGFVGDVHSRKPKCERNRLVTLYYEGTEAGTDTTDETGDWEIEVVFIGDDPYFVTVDRKVIKKGGKKLVCKADTSPSAQLPL